MKFPLHVGILGGGQLSKMLALSAYSLGIRPIIFASSKSDCALDVAWEYFIDNGTIQQLKKFVKSCDLVVIENEFVDLSRLKNALDRTPLQPSIKCLSLIQNKLHQKINLKKMGGGFT